jgi:succinoglycan biosynthesis protein ExoW
MSKPAFTVLIPVHRGPHLLPFAIGSVLAQERQDFELIIICDGAPEATVRCAREAAQRDPRIRASVHPKGERNGEAYRHQALEGAQGRFVCQLADDDYWLPNHLSEMALLLEEADFGNIPQVIVMPDGIAYAELEGDLAVKVTRDLMVNTSYNFFGPSVAGYRLETYRRLPEGWAPAPPDTYSDLHMWRKFLALPGLRCATRVAITNLVFPAPLRKEWPPEKRAAELKRWSEFVKDARNRDRLSQDLLVKMMHAEIARREAERLRRRAAAGSTR